MHVEIGCGARVRDFDGRRYWYFWHYEREGGRSVRKEDYIGRVESERSKADLQRRLLAYHRRAEAIFGRRKAVLERMIAGHHASE